MINKLSNIIILITGILILLCLNNNINIAYAENNIRDLKTDPVSVENNFKDNDSGTDYTKKFSPFIQNSTTLKGGISQLISIVGKSQLIRFDEPVKRLSIANPALADVVMLSRKELLLNGKASGITTLIIWGETGDPVFFDLNVKNDTAAFLEALKEIIPDENDMDIKFADITTAQSSNSTTQGNSATNNNSATNTSSSSSTSKSVIFSGKISSSIVRDKIKDLATTYGFNFVDLAESPTPQVMLEVKVVEASRGLTKNIQATISGQNSLNNFKIWTDPFKSANISTLAAIIKDPTDPTKSTTYLPQLTLGNIRIPILNSDSSLNFQEKKGFLRVLAEPKLVTLNKQKASFNAGQEIPVPSGYNPQTNVATYEYKNVGINLEFTPEILEQSNKILLKLAPEVSQLDPTLTVNAGNGITIYGFKTRKTDTTVELNDGETLIIAGLLQRTDSLTSDQVPYLANVPVIGNLFKSREFIKGETELMIFVTPQIIKSDNHVNGV